MQPLNLVMLFIYRSNISLWKTILEKLKTKIFFDEFYNLSFKNLTTKYKVAESIVQYCFAQNTNKEDKYYTY